MCVLRDDFSVREQHFSSCFKVKDERESLNFYNILYPREVNTKLNVYSVKSDRERKWHHGTV